MDWYRYQKVSEKQWYNLEDMPWEKAIKTGEQNIGAKSPCDDIRLSNEHDD